MGVAVGWKACSNDLPAFSSSWGTFLAVRVDLARTFTDFD